MFENLHKFTKNKPEKTGAPKKDPWDMTPPKIPPEKAPTPAAEPEESVDLFDLLNTVDGYDPNIHTAETKMSSDKDWFAMMTKTRADASLDSMLISSPTVFIREYRKFRLGPGATKDDTMRAIDDDVRFDYIERFGLDHNATWDTIRGKVRKELKESFERHGYSESKGDYATFLKTHPKSRRAIYLEYTGLEDELASDADLVRCAVNKGRVLSERIQKKTSSEFFSNNVDEAMNIKHE